MDSSVECIAGIPKWKQEMKDGRGSRATVYRAGGWYEANSALSIAVWRANIHRCPFILQMAMLTSGHKWNHFNLCTTQTWQVIISSIFTSPPNRRRRFKRSAIPSCCPDSDSFTDFHKLCSSAAVGVCVCLLPISFLIKITDSNANSRAQRHPSTSFALFLENFFFSPVQQRQSFAEYAHRRIDSHTQHIDNDAQTTNTYERLTSSIVDKHAQSLALSLA